MIEKQVSKFKRFLPIILSLVIIISDQITKILVVNYNNTHNNALMSSSSNWIKVIGDWFRIRLGYNNNAIFGLNFGLPDEYKQYILIATTLIAAIVIIIFYTRVKSNKMYPRVCLGLIMGGAFGNLTDRIFGHILYEGKFQLFFEKGVVDWIDAGIPNGVFGLENGWRWYTFNIADSCITVSIILLLIYFIFSKNVDFFIEKNKKVDTSSNTSGDKEETKQPKE